MPPDSSSDSQQPCPAAADTPPVVDLDHRALHRLEKSPSPRREGLKLDENGYANVADLVCTCLPTILYLVIRYTTVSCNMYM